MRPMRFSSLALLIALLSPLAGCRDRIESICRQSCECQPCTDADLQDCMDRGAAAEQIAQKKNCDAKVDAYLACVDDHLSCQHGAGPGTTACSKEEDALSTCTGNGNPFATPCQQAAQKFAKCTGQPVPPSNQSTCPADQECQSKCMLQTTCDALTGATFDVKFQDCTNACFTK